MAAGLGFKTFTTGEVLTAADTNGYLMQGVLVFASAAARDAAITSPQEGQCCYLKDTDAVLTYSGSAWVGFDDSNAVQNSIVDAKGDLIAASAADTPARLAVGANGETLVADSAATTGLRYSATPSASNPVLNSAYQVWQRGTSFTATSGYTADRWYVNHGVAGRTISRQVTGDTTNLPFIQYALRYQRDSGNTNTANNSILYQSFESVNSIPLAGKTVTMSFYARAGANYSAASGRLGVYLISGTGTDQNYGVGYTGAAFPINNGTATLTTTWQRFTFSGTVATTATELTTYFESTPVGTAGANDYFEVTGVQLDIGSVALPFRTYAATIQGELAACQRYYFRYTGGGSYSLYTTGVLTGTTSGWAFVQYPVTPRVIPTALESGNLAFQDSATNILAMSALALGESSLLQMTVSFTVSGGTANRSGRIINNNNSAGFLGMSAEL